MNERVLRVLEYNKVIKQLVSQTATTHGKDLTAELKPSGEFDEVKQLQEETDEAAQIIRLNEVIPLGAIFDIRAALKRSLIGGLLNTEECLNVASTIYGGRQAKAFIENLEETTLPILEELTEQITPLRDLEQRINSCIDDHGHVMDSASVKLRKIGRASCREREKIAEREVITEEKK